MPIEIVVDSLDNVPSVLHPEYTERDGKYHLTGVVGMKTQADIDKINGALAKERNDLKAHKERYGVLGDKDPSEILASLDRIAELEAAAGGKLDETKINEIAEKRLTSKLAPIQRELDTAKVTLAQKDELINGFNEKDRKRTIGDSIREASTKSNVIPTALEDVIMLAERMFEVDENGKVITKDGVGVTPGVDASVWLTDMQAKRPHWWPASKGAGAGGSGGGGGFTDNPFTHDGWNMTAQGQLQKADPVKAAQMAKAAGTTVGGPKPMKKN